MMQNNEPTGGSPSKPIQGFVAILDALGASAYSGAEAEEFLKSRDQVIALITELAKEQIKVDPTLLKRFIFNDTVVLAHVRGITFQDAWEFCHVLRAFESFFIERQIFFRGALGAGDLYRADENANTIMGPAVSDAAAWYARADWIGIHATPQATIFLRSLLEHEGKDLDYVLIDYDVPLKDKVRMRLKAINWPKGFYLNHGKSAEKARAALLSRLAKRPIPMGSESKYFQALEFYAHIEKTQDFGKIHHA